MLRSRRPPAEDIFAALGHRVRLNIVILLLEGERCVCEITPAFRQERTVVSRHLAVLENAGIIRSRKVGRRVFHQIADRRVAALVRVARRMSLDPGRGVPVGPASPLACCARSRSED